MARLVGALFLLGVAACSGGPEPGNDRTLSHAEHSLLQQELVLECLKESGWQVSFDTQDKSLRASVPSGQQSANLQAARDCEAEFLAAFPRPEVTEEQWGLMYEHQRWLVGCLEELGYPLGIPQLANPQVRKPTLPREWPPDLRLGPRTRPSSRRRVRRSRTIGSTPGPGRPKKTPSAARREARLRMRAPRPTPNVDGGYNLLVVPWVSKGLMLGLGVVALCGCAAGRLARHGAPGHVPAR